LARRGGAPVRAVDFSIVARAAPELAQGLLVSLEIAAAGATLAFAVGIAGAAMRLSEARAVRALSIGCTEFFRNTPPLVQIYFLYFALPSIPIVGPALRLPSILAATLGLVLHQGAINVEILRAGLRAVPDGQREAAAALGLSRFDQLRTVLVPQAIRISLPALGNNVISFLKNTSLVSAVGVLDLLGVANDQIAVALVSAPFYVTVAAIYIVLVVIVGSLFRALERRLAVAR
jgi:polar amino acid transport system permease protein